MPKFYEMPAISPTMEVGTLVEWKLEEGQAFEPQTVVAEVGTDKANMEAEVFDEGVFLKRLVEEGDEVPPGFPIAIIGEAPDEDISDLLEEFERRKEAQPADGASEETPSEEAPAPAQGEQEAPPSAEAPEPEVSGSIEREWMGRPLSPLFLDPPGDIRAAGTGGSKRRVAASPLARKVAEDLGVALERVHGTGPGGRILRADVEAAQGQAAATPAPAARESETVRNSPMRKTIARRLLQSHQEIPTFYLTVVFDMERMVQLRETLKGALPDLKVSYNDLMIACVGRALRAYPKANAAWGDKAIVRHGRVDIGMAVALEDGLITPVIRDADTKPLSVIAAETRELAGRAREGQLAEDEYTGGTFSVSNLGMMGIEEFTAILNPPEAGILAIGALQQVPVVEAGEVAVRWRMKATMTCDHRVLDGMAGAEFLQVLRTYVENPFLLVV